MSCWVVQEAMVYQQPEAMQHALLQAEARNPKVPMRTLVSAHMTAWAAGSAYPVAEVRSSLGQAGACLQPCTT